MTSFTFEVKIQARPPIDFFFLMIHSTLENLQISYLQSSTYIVYQKM